MAEILESVDQVQVFGQQITSSKIVTVSVITSFYPTQTSVGYTLAVSPYYGTLNGADSYFRGKLKNTVRSWLDADLDDREAALRQASRILEQLNFAGTPASADQDLHFPTDELGTPNNILIACYEIALKLLDGIDPDTEADNLSVTSQGYAGGRSSFDRTFVQAHIRAGIPSAFAWSILRPYLCDPCAIKIRRGD